MKKISENPALPWLGLNNIQVAYDITTLVPGFWSVYRSIRKTMKIVSRGEISGRHSRYRLVTELSLEEVRELFQSLVRECDWIDVSICDPGVEDIAFGKVSDPGPMDESDSANQPDLFAAG